MDSKSYNIVLVELEKHWDSADGFCRFIYGSNHRLTILTDLFLYDNIKHYPHNKDFSFIIKPGNQSRKDFLVQQKRIFTAADLIFINTIHQRVSDYLYIETGPLTVLRVHNAFRQFKPLHHIKIPPGFFFLRKAASYFYREVISDNFFRNINTINNRVDYFTFLSESITDFVKDNKLVPLQKIMFSIPLLPWEETINIKPKDRIEISIVGSLERRTKDFDIIIKTFLSLFQKNNKFLYPIRLNLLGRSAGAYGEKVIRELTKINHPDFSLNYYIDSVPVIEFDNILSSTHIIISPIRVHNITQIYEEIYGKTKFSGSIGTIMQFHLLGILPEAFSYDKDFEVFFRKYKNVESLTLILQGLFENIELIHHEIKLLRNFLRVRYNKEVLIDKLENFIEQNKHAQEIS